jgi:hypothetical protein
MPRLTADQWADVRAAREMGGSFGELAAKFNVDRAAIFRRAKKEGWSDGADVGDLIRRKVNEKVNAVVNEDPVKKAVAIDAAANQAAFVVIRHRDDWEAHHAEFSVKKIADDFDLGKSAKISAEMLAIRQKGERIAWGLEEAENKPDITIQWAGLAVAHA